MAATVTLNVELNEAGVLAKLKEIDAAAAKISGQKHIIKLEVAGDADIKNITKDLVAYANAQAKAAKATADAEKWKQKAAIANAQARAETERSKRAAEDLAIAEQKAKAAAESHARAEANKESALARSSDTTTNVANAQARLATASNQVAVQQERTAQTANRLAAEQERTAQTANRLAAEQERTARATLNAGNDAQSAASGFSVLGGAIATALGNLSARMVHLAIMKIRQALREALQEMKNVDTELTNISKVSGKTGTELEAIGDAAYDTATKYGVAASEYLSAVYDMQKAGMGDQAQDMGELAIKTMLVGDTTQEVASKFLIASNAAWKLNGDMDRLGQIVDEADYINNNYATTLDKLAAGMPIVASVAENAGMSAEETIAALGTITAATQESGTKAATALRALILNISGEVGKYITEEGEEIEVTKESVSGMQKLLEKYAGAELEAAKAAGKLIDPMTAIRALFKGMANDDLNEAQMFQLLSGMGGKLRTNQLTALVKNYETLYTDMMSHMEEAAGTADSEIDLMMNSWEKKTQVLKNSWTELISDIIETDTIKGGLSWLTDLINDVDGVVKKLNNPWDSSDKAKKQYSDAQEELKDLLSRSDSLNGVEKRRLEILKEITAELRTQASIQTKNDAENINNSLLKNIWAQYDENGFKTAPMKLAGDQARLNGIRGLYRDAATDYTNTGDITSFQDGLKGIVSTYGDYYDQLVRIRDAGAELNDNQKTFIAEYEGIRSASESTITDVEDIGNGLLGLYDAQGNLIAQVQKRSELEREQAERAKEAQEEQEAEITAFEEAANEFDSTYSTNAKLEQEQLDALRNEWNSTATEMGNAASNVGDLTDDSADAADATGNIADEASGIKKEVDGATSATSKLTSEAQAAAKAFAAISLGPMGGFLGVGGLATGTKNAPGGPTLVNELGPELISENGHAFIANGGRPGIVNLSRGAIVLTASETKEALRGGGKGKKIRAAVDGILPGSFMGGSRAKGTVFVNGNPVAITGDGVNRYYKTPQTPPKKTEDDIYRQAREAREREERERALREEERRRELNAKENDAWRKELEAKEKAALEEEARKRSRKNGAGAAAGPSPAEILAQQAKDTKDVLSNIEKQAKLADNRGQYTKEENLWAKGQAEIDKMIAAYRKAGYKDTSDEILDLLNKRYEYEKKKDAASKKTIENAAKELKDKLGVLDKQASVADKEGDPLAVVKYYEKAQEEIKKMIDMYRKAGYKDDSKEILELLEKNVDYGEKQVKVYKEQWNNLIDALEADTEAQDLANKLAEKEQALQEAQQALDNARKQRTIRTYNAATGQWEWVADQSKIKSAQESLTKAEESYSEEVKDQAIKELEKLRDTMADLNNVILGPALSAILLKSESSEEFQNFARALNAVYGVGSYLSSTEGSSKVISTANDSHDTIYTFGNVTLTEEQASSMSVAELAQKLQVLKIS